jgi:aldehyde dehydrogenase (NAD+)
MADTSKFYINGEWVTPKGTQRLDVINPATEEPCGSIVLGTAEDLDRAVAAAKAAFETFSQTSREERMALLEKVVGIYQKRLPEMADIISQEMGAPMRLAMGAQAPAGLGHFMTALQVLKDFQFEEQIGTTLVRHEPIGVCGLITPWNWPMNQAACKIAPALATGCTMVLKPSEIAPLSSMLLAEILHEAGVPKGVFNVVNGDGPTIGRGISSHPDIDFVSFTGSTRAGRDVAKHAAETIKRVAQELGGKSANIILDDSDFSKAVAGGVVSVMGNTGQSCNAPTRMLVPQAKMDEAAEIAKVAVTKVKVGDPKGEDTTMGPVVSETQWNKIQDLIAKGVEEGANLVTGGPGRPDGLNRGYYVRPTVFSHVNNDMTIAREEIFGPVLSILGYKDEEEAIRIANDTRYGLSGYVTSSNEERARKVAKRLRTGMVHVNGAPPDNKAPFGGYKESGNGREWGKYGFHDFLEVKSIFGYYPRG